MEAVPEILDFRPAGPAASKVFVVHNKRNENLDVVLPSTCGPFALSCNDKHCETALASTDQQQVAAAQHLHVTIPAKQFVQFLVEVNSAHLNGHDISGHKDFSCTSGLFPVICLKFPSETGCIVAAGLSAWFEQRWPNVEQNASSFLKYHEVSDQIAKTVLVKATAQLGELLQAQPCSETDSGEYGELEMAHDEGCNGSKTASLNLSCLSHDLKPKLAATVDVDCHIPAFQAVKLEFDGRQACVAKVVPVPYHAARQSYNELVARSKVSQISESGLDAKFQICGKWYDARGKEVQKTLCTQNTPRSGPTHDAQAPNKPMDPQNMRDPIDMLRDAALAAAQTELGLSYLPDPGRAKGLFGEPKPLLPVLKEARGGQAGVGKAGQLGQHYAMLPHRLGQNDGRANAK